MVLEPILTSISFADESKSRGIVDDYTKLKEKIYTSTRTDTPPVIDGSLDDKAWGTLSVSGSFGTDKELELLSDLKSWRKLVL